MATIAVVMPVSRATNAGTGWPGLTSDCSSPRTSPPRTFTAPISVMPESSVRPPVVSRSTTTNVTSRSGVPSSSKDGWTTTGDVLGMARTVSGPTDTPPVRRVERPRQRADVSRVSS
ncbi:hypothetical protein L600_003500000040 [Isoptericola variabilis J7]|nr:hypothetical protein L600_003500000040 [Isoptericola variabilis J7]